MQSIGTDISSQKAILQNIGEDVARAIYEGLDERINDAIEKFCDRLEEKILPQTDKICAAIDNLSSGGSEKIGEIFTKGVGAQMERFSAALDKFSDSIDEKLKASDEIAKVMNEQLLQTLNELNEALKQDRAERDKKDKENSQHHREINESFETLVKNLLADLKDFTERQKEFLGRVANTNTAQISEAVEVFREIVNRHNQTTQKTFAQVQKLLDETETYLQLMDDASTSLKQAAEPVKESTRQLTNNLLETSAQMKNLSTANQQTRQNLFDLSARLREFVTNFNGIANELERSTTIINDSLSHYNFEMSKGLSDALTKFDDNMTKALADFNELVGEFSDMVGYVKRNRR
ncbi:MAG: hypothetical protein SR1Q5_03520 [Quinella sp. 1Q5]|nr:hypothetical protein [Quinella sp. 1Q5]